MHTKKEHLRYKKMHGSYSIGIPLENFKKREIEFLKEWGHWCEALINEDLQTLNVRQEEFVRVAKGELEPKTFFEFTWWKLQKMRVVYSKPGDAADDLQAGQK